MAVNVEYIHALSNICSAIQHRLSIGTPLAAVSTGLLGEAGELLVCIMKGGVLAENVNQEGWDVLVDGRKVSVKLTTNKTGVNFSKSTWAHVDDIAIVYAFVDETERLQLDLLVYAAKDQAQARIADVGPKFRYALGGNGGGERLSPKRDMDPSDVVAQAVVDGVMVKRYADLTVQLFDAAGGQVTPAYPWLVAKCAERGISDKNGAGGQRNTRTMGDLLIKAVNGAVPIVTATPATVAEGPM